MGTEVFVGFKQLSLGIVSSSKHPLRSLLLALMRIILLPLTLSRGFPHHRCKPKFLSSAFRTLGCGLTLPFWPSLPMCASHIHALPSAFQTLLVFHASPPWLTAQPDAPFHKHPLTKWSALVKGHLWCEGFHDSPDDQNEPLLFLGSYLTSLCFDFFDQKMGIMICILSLQSFWKVQIR